MVRSAVSSVRTPGVLVTRIPRAWAAATSMWSTPTPKLAISLSWSPAWAISAASRRSVMVGARTSARDIAATRASTPMGVSSRLSSVSNSSRMRVSTASGSLRVTTTFGLRGAMGGSDQGRGRRDGSVAVSNRTALAGQASGMRRAAPLGAAMAAAGLALAACGDHASEGRDCPAAARARTVSGFCVPRYLSLKRGEVMGRGGPGKDYPALWVYRVQGLPVQVVAETTDWRRICDPGRRRGVGPPLDGRRAPHGDGPGRRPDPAAPRAAIGLAGGGPLERPRPGGAGAVRGRLVRGQGRRRRRLGAPRRLLGAGGGAAMPLRPAPAPC